jgi:hypothetical protein
MMATSTSDVSLYNGKRAREELAATSHDHHESKRLCDWVAYVLLNGIDDDDDGKMQEAEQGVDGDRLLQMMKSLQDEIVVTTPTDQPIAVHCHEKKHILNTNTPLLPPSSYAHQQGELSISHGSSLSYDRKMLTQESKALFIPVERRTTTVKEGPSSSEKQRLIKRNM